MDKGRYLDMKIVISTYVLEIKSILLEEHQLNDSVLIMTLLVEVV